VGQSLDGPRKALNIVATAEDPRRQEAVAPPAATFWVDFWDPFSPAAELAPMEAAAVVEPVASWAACSAAEMPTAVASREAEEALAAWATSSARRTLAAYSARIPLPGAAAPPMATPPRAAPRDIPPRHRATTTAEPVAFIRGSGDQEIRRGSSPNQFHPLPFFSFVLWQCNQIENFQRN